MKMLEILKKYEKELLFTVFVFGIVSIFWSFLANFGLGESGYNFIDKTKKVTLSPGKPITQTFTAHQSNMYQLRLVLGNADIRRDESIEFRLMDAACKETLATTHLSRKPQKQGAYTVFSFPSLPNSEDQHYCFSATYLSDESRKGDKPYLSATDVPDSVFSDRTLTDTNKDKVYPSQTLFLRPAYTSGGLPGDLSRLVERLSQYKPTFLKGSPIVILFGMLILGSAALAYRFVFVRGSTDEEHP